MPLTNIIAKLLAAAAAQPGAVQKRHLDRGLCLQIKIADGITSLGISRAGTTPSLVEWQTVLRALPYPLSIQHPLSGLSSDGRYTLWAEWPTPTQEQAL